MAAAGSRLLCGVELISPKAACAIARARSSLSPRWRRRQLRRPQVDVLALEGAHPLAGLGRQRLPVAVLDDDQRLVRERERRRASRPAPRALPGVGGLRDPLLTLGQQPLADVDEHLGQHRVLGVEVLVERRAADAHGLADVADGDAVEAALGEQPRGRVEDLVPALEGRSTGSG